MNLLLLFEVMDKEFPLEFICLYSLLVGFGGFWLTRWNPVFVVLPFLLALFSAYALLTEINDPYVGPAILSEAGYSYVIFIYVSIILGFVLPLAGIPAWAVRRRQKRSLP